MDILVVLFWSLIGSVFSLIGGILLVQAQRLRKKVILYALPFGAGALLATAILSLLPEAIELSEEPHEIVPYILVGFLSFFLFERFVSWIHRHHHHDHHGSLQKKAQVWRVVVGDTLHNAVDGIAIGVAFLVNIPAGIAAALAVAAHEIPQEIGDASILLSRGMKPRKVIMINVLSSLATVFAAVSVYALGGVGGIRIEIALALAAGFFLYIAASDIIPEIHENPRRLANIQAILLVVGVLVIAAITANTSHQHEASPASHEAEHHTE
jgi:zinc and cadmium transporter